MHGEESYLVERAIRTLRRRAGDATDWRVVWGDDDERRIHEALATRASPGLFGGASAVLLRRAEGLRAANEEALEAAMSDEGAEGLLVVAGGALDRRKRWYGVARAQAVEVLCSPVVDGRELRRWVDRIAAERGVRLGSDGADELIDRCAGELAILDGEIEKLAASDVAQPVDRRAVAALVAGGRGHAIEALTDRLARGDRAGALRVLRGLLDADEPGLRIVAFLAANLRRALHVAEQHEAGASLETIASSLKMPEWLVRRQLGRGSAAQLERGLEALGTLDLALKRSRPEAAAFEAAIDELLGSAR